jgi:hypothetical protein
VAKPSGSAYRPGYRGWIKVKNPDYWRRNAERRIGENSQRRALHRAA